MSIRSELDQMKAELEALRKTQAASAGPAPEADAAAEEDGAPASLEQQLKHLMALAEEMLNQAEDTIVEHPTAAVAGALALGIVIGRLTAR